MQNLPKKFGIFVFFILAFILSKPCFADDVNNFRGASFDVGVPDGIGIGFVVRPIRQIRLNTHFTHNSAAPGYRFGMTLDPINFIIAPTATIEYGASAPGQIVGLDKSPFISYDYTNLHFGLEIGNRDYFRFYLRGGISFIDIRTKSIGLILNQEDITIASDPSFKGMISPTGKIGFATFF